MIIYSKNGRIRAELVEVDGGIEVSFYRDSGKRDNRDGSPSKMWRLTDRETFTDFPFSYLRDRVHQLIG